MRARRRVRILISDRLRRFVTDSESLCDGIRQLAVFDDENDAAWHDRWHASDEIA